MVNSNISVLIFQMTGLSTPKKKIFLNYFSSIIIDLMAKGGDWGLRSLIRPCDPSKSMDHSKCNSPPYPVLSIRQYAPKTFMHLLRSYNTGKLNLSYKNWDPKTPIVADWKLSYFEF